MFSKYRVTIYSGVKGCTAYLIEKETNKIVSTGKSGGYYKAIVEALENMGLVMDHPYSRTKKEMDDIIDELTPYK